VAAALLLLISLAGVAISVGVHPVTASGSHPATADASSTGAAIVDDAQAVHVETAAGTATVTGAQIAAEAASLKGTPYCNGGGTYTGPTNDNGACSAPGFSCMSLVQYVIYQTTGIEVPNPSATSNWRGAPGTYIDAYPTVAEDEAALDPGDVVIFGGSTNNYAHDGIYAGNGMVWDDQPPITPASVQLTSFSYIYGEYNDAYDGGVRYAGSESPPPFSITTTSLPAATIGKRYAGAQLTTTGGTAPYKWTASGLPRGLKVSAKTGLLKGTVKSSKRHPQAAGSYSVAVTVTDSASAKASASLTLKLDAAS
jgi:cell wall-associated NlpC family hydrolase